MHFEALKQRSYEITRANFEQIEMVSVLSEAQLKRLGKHKYNASCTTLLDPYLQVWWEWVVVQLPLWIAPNTLTIMGLLTNLATTLVLVYFAPHARSEVSFIKLRFAP